MRLFYSPFHSFVHKTLVTAHEAGLWDRITFVPTYPFRNRKGEEQGDLYSIAALNPLNKVPTLATETGRIIFGSQAIAEYLDSRSASGRSLYPPPGEARWDALTRLALADTMFESSVQLVMEGWQPQAQQRLSLFEWIWPKIIRGLDRLESACATGFSGFDIGQAAMLHAISYMDFRIRFYTAKDPLYPEFDVFGGRPALKAWYDRAVLRPSVQSHYQKDYEGDDSPAHCQRHVQAVLALQKEHGTT